MKVTYYSYKSNLYQFPVEQNPVLSSAACIKKSLDQRSIKWQGINFMLLIRKFVLITSVKQTYHDRNITSFWYCHAFFCFSQLFKQSFVLLQQVHLQRINFLTEQQNVYIQLKWTFQKHLNEWGDSEPASSKRLIYCPM